MFIHPFIVSVSHSFHWHIFFTVIPPLIYLPSSVLILKSSCSTALMCLEFAESASNTSWADADMESKKSVILTPASAPAVLLCHSVPAFNSYMCLLSPANLLYGSLLHSLYFTCFIRSFASKTVEVFLTGMAVPGNQRSTCLKCDVWVFHVTFWWTFIIHTQMGRWRESWLTWIT